MALFISSFGDGRKGDSFYELRELVKYEHITLDGAPFLKAEVDVPITGQRFGFGDFDPTTVYLTDRLVSETGDDSIQSLKKFPIESHAFLVKDRGNTNVTSVSELQRTHWVSIYDNKEVLEKEMAAMEKARGE
jgi:hypothetical protein